MATAPTPQRVTYEQWLTMPVVEGMTEEVVDGEIILMPANKWGHTGAVQGLFEPLFLHLDRSKYAVVIANFGLIIQTSPLTSRVPDLAVFRRDKMVIRDGYVHSAPLFIAEVISPANTGREQNRLLRDYESIGVPEVWLLSRDARSVTVLRLRCGRLVPEEVQSEGRLRVSSLPEDVQVDVEAIW